MSRSVGIIQESTGGLQTLSGGTRNAAKTNRPWQPKLSFVEKKECPLCSRVQLDEYSIGPGWKTFQNSNTPFSYHRLLIPTECWSETDLRSLKSTGTINRALWLALAEIERTRELPCSTWVYTHVGYETGQNIAHNHWHLLNPPNEPCTFHEGEDSVELWTSENFKTTLCGVRAGQTIIRTNSLVALKNPVKELQGHTLLKELAREAAHLINRFNANLNNPDFCLFFAFHANGEWYARYTPILNHWGGSEFAALDHGTPFVLPWSHESTRDRLLSD